MPANLTPAYKKVEAKYRQAREPRERLDLLREMLRTIPKHKGTDHLQADIKTKIKELTEELTGPRKSGGRGGPPTVIHPDGAGQIALLGPPNSGKSALHHSLTHSGATSAPYPFTTLYPQPGMLPCDDVAFQIVDLPPISPEHPVPWIANVLQPADGCLLVIDLAKPGCVEDVLELENLLRQRRAILDAGWPGRPGGVTADEDDPFTINLPTLVIATKAELIREPAEELATFRELSGCDYPALVVSAETGEGLDAVGPWLFEALQVVRVYTKIPGKPADMDRPFTVRPGQTVLDVATLVHKDIAAGLKYARIWGPGSHDGQHVGAEHIVVDGDILELHV